ncbi:MAG: hypothetical protein MJ087_05620 [Lachnospiraceae bacterium]|nr:hypothetical protein [Lachnospiraceae bacterium]
MKKLQVLLIVGLIMLGLCACGKKESSTDGMPNPVQEVASLEELAKTMNCAMIKPEGVEISDETFSVIQGEPKIGQYTFTVDGQECMLRFADADVKTDISGVYPEDQEGKTLYEDDVDNDHGHYIENDNCKAYRWFTVDGQYIFYVEDKGDWEWDQFEQVYKPFIEMKPVNWTSDVSFEEYKALEGTYADENSEYVAMIMQYMDHVEIYEINQTDEGNHIWEASAVLDGDQLKFEKGRYYLVTYDEDKGESNEKELGTEKAGSLTIKDKQLTFNQVSDETIKGLTLKLSE